MHCTNLMPGQTHTSSFYVRYQHDINCQLAVMLVTVRPRCSIAELSHINHGQSSTHCIICKQILVKIVWRRVIFLAYPPTSLVILTTHSQYRMNVCMIGLSGRRILVARHVRVCRLNCKNRNGTNSYHLYVVILILKTMVTVLTSERTLIDVTAVSCHWWFISLCQRSCI